MDSLAFRRSLIRAFGNFHAWAYEVSGGRCGGRLQGLPMVLLHVVGRKSGKPRRTPLLYMKAGEDLVIVASFYGSPGHPAWYHNLMANPECAIRVGRRRYRARARTANSEEREKLWPLLVDFYPDYAAYQSRTDREIPVVILSPAAGGAKAGDSAAAVALCSPHVGNAGSVRGEVNTMGGRSTRTF